MNRFFVSPRAHAGFTLISIVFLATFAWAQKRNEPTAIQPDRSAPESVGNELTAHPRLWSADGEGVEVQISVPVKQMGVKETHLPVVVWFRNTTKTPLSLESIYPAFAPHGGITVVDEGGKNIIVGGCNKKHLKQEIILAPGEQRGFLGDAFRQMCHGRPEGDLKSGKYTIQFRGSNKVTVEVIR